MLSFYEIKGLFVFFFITHYSSLNLRHSSLTTYHSSLEIPQFPKPQFLKPHPFGTHHLVMFSTKKLKKTGTHTLTQCHKTFLSPIFFLFPMSLIFLYLSLLFFPSYFIFKILFYFIFYIFSLSCIDWWTGFETTCSLTVGWLSTVATDWCVWWCDGFVVLLLAITDEYLSL